MVKVTDASVVKDVMGRVQEQTGLGFCSWQYQDEDCQIVKFNEAQVMCVWCVVWCVMCNLLLLILLLPSP